MDRRNFLTLAGAAMLVAALPVRAQSVLKVGSSASGLPFSYLDPLTNTVEGALADLVRKIGAVNGFQPEIQGMQFSSLVPALTSGKIDLIASALLITPERREVIAFTDPVYTYGEGLFVVDSDKTAYTKISDLKGQTVGIQVGSAYIDSLRSNGLTDFKYYNSTGDTLADIQAGRIQAAFADAPQASYRIRHGQFPGVRIVESYVSTIKNSVGFGLRKDQAELLEVFNAAIAKLKADNTVDSIAKKWDVS
ncbi:Amino acid ABC transporter substrate-binding protein [Pseudomonas amygdali pv. eriobotryae]|uniref:Amino acid ABC transporter substrate-binding protein n=1 Tax=Pseudomonas amygdali pv. eriobotryae TaxID=129137 RepID=A0A0P9Q0W1_PSEA0|nr:ABC transporter substrate-binding protein [Pseudomonas amygdali]KPX20649.1 Amino acid ABC transporter substrate-binding protein [Pseudomonas amygdali pv. eriobotryae]KWS78393.1 hypothetical protein AL052_01290 [Pseudomonas amygdali pv. eriobotryae]RMM02422.1 Amino acid ABC transporter substrate-binding protein [Pseudomonas amygdali pv. eriobotryae]GFZ62742.1 amino acid ABC transporter substrate-binding protein [Pseudomonas amygdali pv. eriobotryae]GFZ73894.1 amino acid ABC transporter subst